MDPLQVKKLDQQPSLGVSSPVSTPSLTVTQPSQPSVRVIQPNEPQSLGISTPQMMSQFQVEAPPSPPTQSLKVNMNGPANTGPNPATPPPPKPNPIENFVQQHVVSPAEQMAHDVNTSLAAQNIRFGVAKLTGNEQAAQNAVKGMRGDLPNNNAKPLFTRQPNGQLKANPAAAQTVANLSMGMGESLSEVPEVPNDAPRPGELSEEDVQRIFQNNPANQPAKVEAASPARPGETVSAEPVAPGADELARQEAILQQSDQTPNIDFSKVKGAGQELAQTTKQVAQMLKGIDDQATGGQLQRTIDGGYIRTSEHSPFYRQIFEETGRKPNMTDWLKEAQDYMRRKMADPNDPEGQQFSDVLRRAQAEQELKEYEQANRQSGYNQAKFKKVPGQPKFKKGMSDAQLAKFKSPEYSRRLAAWQKLENASGLLNGSQREIQALERQYKQAKSPDQIRGMQDRLVQARYRRNLLQNLRNQYGQEYGAADQALNEAYPDTVLYKKGRAGNTVKISGVKTGNEPVARTPRQTAEPELGEGPWGFIPQEHAPYEGPNLNEGAFGPEDREQMSQQLAQEKVPPQRNLAGDEAAFYALNEGKSMNEAIAAYMDATGATAPEAAKALGYIAEEGALPETEALMSRNPAYKSFPENAPRDMEDVRIQANKFGTVLRYAEDKATQAYEALSDHDKQLMERSRGVDAATLANQAEDPAAMMRALHWFDTLQDNIHEMRRLYGDTAPYRQNYRAGLHTKLEPPEGEDLTPTPEDSYSQDYLGRIGGYTRPRNINNYDEIPNESMRQRANNSILEDLHQDVNSAAYYVHDRAIQAGVDKLHGQDATQYGAPDYSHPKQLNGTTNVFAKDEVAKEWNKLNPQQKERAWWLKPFDATTSAIVQAVVQNPAIHGSNQLAQAFEAAGAISHIGIDGGAKLGANLVKGFSDDELLQFYKEGNHSPTYGKNDLGFIDRATKGLTNLNHQAMAAIELRIRMALWKTLREGNMDAETARQTIDKFLGDQKVMGDMAANFGFFWHYFKTTTGSLYHMFSHAPSMSGAIVNTVVLAGLMYGLNKAWQEFSGNKNAKTHIPGNIGVGLDIYNSLNDLRQKHFLQSFSILGNRLNPVIREAVAQFANKDLTFGNNIQTKGGNAGKVQRIEHIANLTPETAAVSYWLQNKRAPGESIVNLLTGATLPHAKGYQAAPNAPKSGPLSIVNTPGAKAGNGMTQQRTYYTSVEQANNKFLKGPQDQKAFTLVNQSVDGKSVVDVTSAKDVLYLMYPDTFKANQYIAQHTLGDDGKPTAHDPIFDLNPQQVNTYLTIEYLKNVQKNNAAASQMESDNASWLNPFYAQRTAFYNSLNAQGSLPNVKAATNMDFQFPQVSPQLSTELDAMQGMSPTDKYNYIQSHPDVAQYFQQYNDALNKQYSFYGEPALNQYPTTTSDIQNYTNQYMNATKAQRTALRTGNPQLFQQMQSYLAQTTIFDIINEAQKLQFAENQPTQQFLGKVYDAGQYDIAKGTNAQGQSTYQLSPELAYSGGSSGGYSFSGSNGGYSKSKSSSKKPFVPRPRVVHAKGVKLHKPPRRVRVTRVKLAKTRQGIPLKRPRVNQPVKVARPIKVAKLI